MERKFKGLVGEPAWASLDKKEVYFLKSLKLRGGGRCYKLSRRQCANKVCMLSVITYSIKNGSVFMTF